VQNYGRLINRMNAYSIEKMIVVTKRLLEQEGDDSSWNPRGVTSNNIVSLRRVYWGSLLENRVTCPS